MTQHCPPSTSHGDFEVTVAIPARNAARTIGRCLAAVRELRPRPIRILVLDDHCEDLTTSISRSTGADVIQVPGEGGLGRARNLALELCTTRYLAFFNADCYPEPDWLATLRQVLASTGSAVAGGRQIELRHGTYAERWKALHLRQDLGDRLLLDPDFLSGGNLLLDLHQVGGIRFGEQYRAAYEDVDFCRRLRATGRRLVYDPSATVGHDHRESLRTLPAKVWSYGALSPTVGPVLTVAQALRAFVRMHRRPRDQLRTALLDDLRHGRVGFLAVDLYLLAASLLFFVGHAIRPVRPSGPIQLYSRATHEGEKHAQSAASHNLPGHNDLQQQVPQLRDLEAPPAQQGARQPHTS